MQNNPTQTTPAGRDSSRIGANAREDVDHLFEVLEKKGFQYGLGWCWEGGSSGRRGANRDGVLSIYDSNGQRLHRLQFVRSSISWGEGDYELNRVHTGSNRHYAVVEALELLQH